MGVVLSRIYDVSLASSAEAALHHLRSRDFDVVVTDVRMPGISGLDLLRAIKENWPTTEVVIVTAFTVPSVLNEALAWGALALVEKPFSIQDIDSAVREACAFGAISRRISDSPELRSNFDNIKTGLARLRLKNHLSRLSNTISPSATQDKPLPPDADSDDLPIDVLMGTLSGLVHNLNNTLSSIKLGTEFAAESIKHQDLDSSQKHLAKVVQATTAHGRILTRLRNTVGRLPGKMKPVALKPILEDVAAHLSKFRDDRLSLETLPSTIHITGDRELLWLLFDNLMSNGLDAVENTPAGHVTTTTQISPEGDAVIITISDNGCGISEDALKRIYDPVYTTKPNGLGIGLYLVRRSVRLHGGSISCQSEVGVGTKFYVHLPLSPASSQ